MNFQAHRFATRVMPFVRSAFPVLLFAYLSACSGSSGRSSSPTAISSGGPGDPVPTHSITLAWDAPIENVDGTTLDDLAGYKIYDRDEPGPYTMVTDVGFTTEFTMDLPAGDYDFAVTAYDSSGNESDPSVEIPATLPFP